MESKRKGLIRGTATSQYWAEDGYVTLVFDGVTICRLNRVTGLLDIKLTANDGDPVTVPTIARVNEFFACEGISLKVGQSNGVVRLLDVKTRLPLRKIYPYGIRIAVHDYKFKEEFINH